MKPPAFQFYPRDWLVSPTVERLHAETSRGVGAYMYLLSRAWLSDVPGTLPNDQHTLQKLAQVTDEEWTKIWPILQPQFPVGENGTLYNQKLQEVWENQQRFKEMGRKGGKRPRKK